MLFFADTYALIDFLKGNKAYQKYFTEHEILTTKLNLLELYYSALLEDSEEKAEQYYNAFLPKAIETEDSILKNAAHFKLHHRKQNISYIDAIGYETAKAKKIKFLTGDKEFKKLLNVEFVQ